MIEGNVTIKHVATALGFTSIAIESTLIHPSLPPSVLIYDL